MLALGMDPLASMPVVAGRIRAATRAFHESATMNDGVAAR